MFLGDFGRTLALVLVLEIVEAVTAFTLAALHQVGEEGVVLGVPVAHGLHLDDLLVLDVEDDVPVLLALLDFVELVFTFLGYGDA